MRVCRLGAETQNAQSPCMRVSGRARWRMEGEMGERRNHCTCLVKLLLFQTLISYRFRESPTKLLLFWTPGSGDMIQILNTTSVWTRHLGDLRCASWPQSFLVQIQFLWPKQKAPKDSEWQGQGLGKQDRSSLGDRITSDCAPTWPLGALEVSLAEPQNYPNSSPRRFWFI